MVANEQEPVSSALAQIRGIRSSALRVGPVLILIARRVIDELGE